MCRKAHIMHRKVHIMCRQGQRARCRSCDMSAFRRRDMFASLTRYIGLRRCDMSAIADVI